MAFTIEQARTFHSQASEVLEILSDAVDSAMEYIDTLNDKDADDDDKGMAEQNLEDSLDVLQGMLVSLDSLVGSM